MIPFKLPCGSVSVTAKPGERKRISILLVASEPVWSANKSTGPSEVPGGFTNSFVSTFLRFLPLPIFLLNGENMLFPPHTRAGCGVVNHLPWWITPRWPWRVWLCAWSKWTLCALTALLCLSAACYPLHRGSPLPWFVGGCRHMPAKSYK